MISKNFHWKGNKPILLEPCGKDYLWGGRRLKDDFSKPAECYLLAETWECSTHPDGLCVAASGEFQGKPLAEILHLHPEFLGTHNQTKGELPILVKLIDAAKDLSIQVHPDDAYAKDHENGQLGKSEMWYVLDAEKDAKLIYGMHHTVNGEDVKQSIADGTIEKYLQKIPVRKDDVFYVEAGTVHAIGAGILLVEIQENSNLTYRLYDYDRVDENGKKRELHIKKALEVADLTGSMEPRQPLRVLKYRQGCAMEMLCRCRYFEVYRMLLNTERCRTMVDYRTGSISYHVLLCIGGCGTILMADGDIIHFIKGDCIFVPADSVNIKLHGKAQFLAIRG